MLLLFINLVVATQLTFDQPGEYQLTPEMYNFADEITVELWGAGGGGCSGDCGIGGGSGAYIKATLNTNLESFYLIVGASGKGGRSYTYITNPCIPSKYPWEYEKILYSGYNGTNTVINSNSNSIIAGGGLGGNWTSEKSCTTDQFGGRCMYTVNNGGKYIINYVDGIVDIALDGNSGEVSTNMLNSTKQCNISAYTKNYIIRSGDGGQAYMGGKVGKGNSKQYCCNNCGWACWTHVTCDIDYTYMNATSPGSGGGGSLDTATTCGSCECGGGNLIVYFRNGGDGGNGTIIVTFDSCPTSSATSHPSPSVTSSSEDIPSADPSTSPSHSPYPEYHYWWYTFSSSHTRMSSTSSQTRSPIPSMSATQSITGTSSQTGSPTSSTSSTQSITSTSSQSMSTTQSYETTSTSTHSLQDNEIIYSLILFIVVLVVVIILLVTLVLTCMLRVKNNIYINQTAFSG